MSASIFFFVCVFLCVCVCVKARVKSERESVCMCVCVCAHMCVLKKGNISYCQFSIVSNEVIQKWGREEGGPHSSIFNITIHTILPKSFLTTHTKS